MLEARDSMTVLVTGATGLVGNNVVRQLLIAGESVRALVRAQSDTQTLAELDIEISHGDIRDRAAVQKAVQGCSAVVHAAGRVRIGWTGLEEMREHNVLGTKVVAESARDANARMIHISSVDALSYGTAKSPVTEENPHEMRVACPYVVTKREAEVILLDMVPSGLDLVIVNPSYMLGPWDWKPSSGKLLLEVARVKPFFAPSGTNDFTSVVDVANGIISAIRHGRTGERYILSGEHHTYFSVFRIMAEVVGNRKPFIRVGWGMLYLSGLLGNLRGKLTGQEGDINSAAVQLMRQPHFYSHAKATKELGYAPRCLKTAIEEAWAWFCEHGYVKDRVCAGNGN